MTITEGLFQLDMIDHHAVLGFSLAASPKQLRKRYLKVARKLHPDALREASETERKLASELLSKQVNPAYEVLHQDKSAKEHKILLKMKQKQLSANRALVTLTSDSAKALLNAPNLEADYTATLEKIALTQFDDLTRVNTVIAEISELNAVYLMRKQPSTAKAFTDSGSEEDTELQTKIQTSPPAAASSHTAPSAAQPAASSSTSSTRGNDIIQRYIKRAQEFEAQQDYSRGILEVREAIASHPKNAACHAYLSSLYLKSGQATLAKIHAKQALVFNPDNETAKAVQTRLAAQAGKTTGKKQPANRAKNAQNNSGTKGQKKGGGLLSGLFGGKKR
ncbi:MAG: J domain-containing protein [Cyanobacteria bacterium J06598_1]